MSIAKLQLTRMIACAALLTAALFVAGCGDDHMSDDDMGEMHSEMDGDHHQQNGRGGAQAGMADEELEPSGNVADGVRVVDVKARKFEFDPSQIVVAAGEKIRLNVTSEDVTHGIEIEGYDIDRKLPPNETQTIEFTAGEPGKHHFHCSVYCGAGHNDMHGELVVVESAAE